MQHVKQGKSETYNYTQSKITKPRVNDCSKVKLHRLLGPLTFISLDPLDQ